MDRGRLPRRACPPTSRVFPPNGPRGFVLVSVPGTPQAQEALIEAQIPQQARCVDRRESSNVVYAGAPQFVADRRHADALRGRTLRFVIQTGEGDWYFSCYQGAWFVAPAPNGPWALATSVPAVIYTIPPSSPLYPCTFVRVYASRRRP